MEILKRHEEINYEKYESEENLEAYYHLPVHVKFCKECVVSNQMPNSCVEMKNGKEQKKETIHFDSDGLCDACKVAKQKENMIDWEERERQLFDLCDKYRKSDGTYDCLVPGSGGKDSFYASYLLKYKYHMHPLTVTWAPHMYTPWGYDNFQAWIASGMDNITVTPNSKVHRIITRLATEILLHPYQPFMIGQKNIAPKIAVKLNIPLIFYGENQAEYGNSPIKNNDNALMDASFFSSDERNQLLLGGIKYQELIDDFHIDPADLELYMPTLVDDIDANNIEMHYLGYYEKWHPKEIFKFAAEHSDFKPSPVRTAGTYTNYAGIDDKIEALNFYTTFIKFGIGRATYDASQEVRNKEITREEGMELIRKYDGEWPSLFEEDFMKYLSLPAKDFPDASKWFEQPIMDKEYFMHLCDRFRSPHIWKYTNGEWKLRNTVY